MPRGVGMTIFAGIVSRRPGRPIPEPARRELSELLSRHPGEQVMTRVGADWLLAKVDIGAYGHAGIVDGEQGDVSLLAGDPIYLERHDGRHADLQALHRDWQSGDWSSLRECRGTFAAAHFDPASRRLYLVADKLGVRPVYYWANDDWVVFSTAFRVLERLSLVERRIDLRGVTEKACFTFPLADRTIFDGVHTIAAGEVVSFDGGRIDHTRYWRWDELPALDLPPDELAAALYARFKEAVARRLRGDRTALSFLSGGLDSRAIVAVLSDVGAHIHTLNFAPVGTQDELFGAEIAKRLGTRHLALPQRSEAFGEQQRRIFDLWHDSLQAGEAEPEHPRLIWSGDGGSVGVGHVYLTPEMVQMARQGKLREAAQAFLDKQHLAVPRSVLKRDAVARLADLPVQGIVDEVNTQHCADRGRALHLFLMNNDQRRHLADHFENIDVRRIELHLPFFDAHFMAGILASPIDGFLRHRFYNLWLGQFPAAAREVPWQSYPGHEACPLPMPEGLRYQWRDVFSDDVVAERRRKVVEEGLELLRSAPFPSHVIDRLKLRLMLWAMKWGVRDTAYVVSFVRPYVRCWQHCRPS